MGVGDPGAGGERSGARLSTSALTVVAAGVGALVTTLILGTPYLVFGYHSPGLHLVLSSVDACVALLASYLVYGRFLRSRLLQDLLLAAGLLTLALAGLGLASMLHLVAGPRGALETWLPLTVRTAGAALIVGAALVGSRRQVTGAGRRVWSGIWVVLLVGGVVMWVLRDALPDPLGAAPPVTAVRPVVTGHPALLAAQAFAAVCFLVASTAFTLKARRGGDELLRWLGPACALGGFARVNYVLFPSLYSDWLYTGDLLRTGFYLLLLVGAAREIRQYWSLQSQAAVLEDRRRLARELHDGVVQELGYIRAEAHRVLAAPAADDRGAARRILASCDRALDESRAAVEALGSSGEEPLGVALHRAAEQVARRYDAVLEVELDPSVTADPDQRHALVRITREAVSNAIRHGGARRVALRLQRAPEGHRLVVRDEGAGFDVAAVGVTATGFGLTSMRERAEALPGAFEISSRPGTGTTVGVTW